ncbi:MAG: ABC transporter permease [Bdellovibrionaceae bacterium]|nr:ABC transporter permease [Pseudobdellovibrionaceae bacterium]
MKIKYAGFTLLAGILFFAIFAEKVTGFAFNFQDTENILLSPNLGHWFGTDSLGRDLFTRVFIGARVSLFVAVFSSTLAMFIGIAVGTFAGWNEGWTERIIIRAVDVLQSVPGFLLVSLLCLFLQSFFKIGDFSLKTLLALSLSIALVHWFNVAKIARGQTKQLKNQNYVEAARALGASPFRILTRHLLPNMQGTLLILFTMQIPASILYESMISFAGYGLQSPQVSWGILLQEGWRNLSEFPHLLLLPASVLFLTVLSLHLILGENVTKTDR